jgi:hydroxymethylpyrimidine/phosphomethylpyrimidine kinase
MQAIAKNIPVVMVFSYLDPCGGSGIQADIETLMSMGCHCAPVTTAIAARDTINVKDYSVCPTALVVEQARAVLEDMPVAAIKIGLVGCLENVSIIHTLLMDYPDIPVIFHPVLSDIGATPTVDEAILAAIYTLLCPLTTVLTPNSYDLQKLTQGADTNDACAQKLLEIGCQYILTTGTHDLRQQVINTLYDKNGILETYTWQRLPFNYLGSGCTLSASIAGLLAKGLSPHDAISQAQNYTWQTLKHGFRIGMGLPIPNRHYWLPELSWERESHE